MAKKINDTIIPMCIADGRKAIEYIRTNAKTFGIDPNKIGIIGFSAGGTVTLGATLGYDAISKPNFSAPIYPYSTYFKDITVPADAPPMFICVTTDDSFGFASSSANLYNSWIKSKKDAELHIFSKGHGFGIRKQTCLRINGLICLRLVNLNRYVSEIDNTIIGMNQGDDDYTLGYPPSSCEWLFDIIG
jgi:dienelactone hydrolase